MIHLKTFNEMIKIPIKVGDTILGGRFKNKKVVVKNIGKNDKGDITINGKPLLKYRIVKESNSYDKLQDDVNVYLAHLKDDGFLVEAGGSQAVGKPIVNNYYVRIWLSNKDEESAYSYKNAKEFNLLEIKDEVLRFIDIILEDWSLEYLYTISKGTHRNEYTLDELDNLDSPMRIVAFGQIQSMVIGLTKEVDRLDESVSIFSQDIKSLLPESIDLITTNGQFYLELKDVLLNGDLVQILYYHNTFDKSGDPLSDGEPDYLEIDIHTLKDNDGTEANPDTLRLNIDITYGDSMMFSFTIDSANKVKVHHYDGVGSKYDSDTKFYFSDDTINDLVEFFNRFDNKFKLTPKDFNFLDSDPNSYQPNL